MAEPYKHIYKVDLNQQMVRRDVGLLATFDSKANRFGAELYRDGASVSASGYTVTGYFIRPDDQTVTITGTVEGNLVYVDLPSGCYLYDGAFEFSLKIKKSDEEKTVLMCYGTVERSRTDAKVSGNGVAVTVTNAEKLGGVDASNYLLKADGLKFELLWQASSESLSSSVPFPAQNLNLGVGSLTKYKMIVVVLRTYYQWTTTIFLTPECTSTRGLTNNKSSLVHRNISSNLAGGILTFQSVYVNGTEDTSYDAYLKPQAIYGL